MKGLFKSNFLAVWTNAKIFLLFMFAMGIAVIIIPDQTWQMYFIIIGIVGLAVNAATVIGNEFSSKWGKYKLTLPVKFIPIVYLAGEDKTIVFLIISLICALGIATMLFNIPLFGPFILIGCSILLFIVSFPLTVGIFKKKEY